MTNLKHFTVFFLFSYLLLLLMGIVESVWYAGIFTSMNDTLGWERLSNFYPLMEQEVRIHFWLKLLSYISLFFFMVFWNHLVKKHRLGKGYHVLIILLGFLPLVNYALLYVIWRDLNKALYIRAGKRYSRSDQLIIFIWISTVLTSVLPFLVPFFSTYYSSSVSITMIAYYSTLLTFIHSVCLAIISLLLLLYFLGLKQTILLLQDSDRKIDDHELLD